MPLLTSGYFPNTYFPSQFWMQDYWAEYGIGAPPIIPPTPTLIPASDIQKRRTKKQAYNKQVIQALTLFQDYLELKLKRGETN